MDRSAVPEVGTRTEVPIGGRVRIATLKRVRAKDVLLDGENPRIRYALTQRRGELPQSDLRDLLLRQPGADDLMRRVRDNGGLLEPIYLRPDLRVIEGNCRTAVCLHLMRSHPSLANIPAWVFEEIDERDVAVLQGAYHVAGKIKWRAHEQAGHLHHMRHQLRMSTEEIAKEVGLQERVVKRLLETYAAMNKHVMPRLQNDGLSKFSYFEELYKRDDLSEFRSKPENVRLFADLVVEGKIDKGTQVRYLPQIIEHGALKTLQTQSFNAALEIVGKVDPTAGDPFLAKLQKVADSLQNPPAVFLRKVRGDANARQILAQLRDAATALLETPRRSARKSRRAS